MEEGIQYWHKTMLNIYIWIVLLNLVYDYIRGLVNEFKYNGSKKNTIIPTATEIQPPLK